MIITKVDITKVVMVDITKTLDITKVVEVAITRSKEMKILMRNQYVLLGLVCFSWVWFVFFVHFVYFSWVKDLLIKMVTRDVLRFV